MTGSAKARLESTKLGRQPLVHGAHLPAGADEDERADPEGL
jgi:hypothetical protein